MKSLKRILCIALAAIMILCFAGCSTPKVALTVDGKDYSTGEYLAYLLDGFQQGYYNGGLYYYEQQGYDIWSQTYTYESQQLELAEYLKAMTVDTIIRQKAIENMMAEAGVTADEELVKQVQTQMIDMVEESLLLEYGINKESYTKMCMAYYCNEASLFLSRYDKDGSSPIPEEDVRKYFDDNYLSYKMISVGMMNGEEEMSETEQKAITDELQKYLDLYEDGKTFNEVIAQYNYDISTSSDKKLEELTDDDTRQNMDAGTAEDEDLANAVKSVKEGEAKIVTYKSGGTDLTAALIFRMDPEEGEGYDTYFEDSRESILYSIKGEEFDAEVQKVADALQYTVNERAYKMCDPKEFVSLYS